MIETELSEIKTSYLVITNKVNALNSYLAKLLQKDGEERQRRKAREEEKETQERATIPTKDINKRCVKKAVLKKPNDKKGKRKSSAPK
jgi:hypothetical protein